MAALARPVLMRKRKLSEDDTDSPEPKRSAFETIRSFGPAPLWRKGDERNLPRPPPRAKKLTMEEAHSVSTGNTDKHKRTGRLYLLYIFPVRQESGQFASTAMESSISSIKDTPEY